jgi:protein-S-isoprenylcysteine O-methyltransferase Ste14
VHSRRTSIAAYVVLVLAILGLFANRSILARTATTIAAQVISVLLMIWARATFGLRSFHAGADPTEGGLVTWGPYRFLRHPIYSAVLLFSAAAVVSHLTWPNAALLALATVAVAVRITCEEHLLKARYPEYEIYAARTRRLIPFLL